MTKLENVFPKDSFFLSMIYALAFSSILFGLSWYITFASFVLDTCVFLFIIKNLEIKVFFKVYPRFETIRSFEEEAFKTTNLTDQNNLFNLVAEFPEKRALFTFFGSLVKVLPVGIFIAAQSTITDSFWQNLLLFYVVDVFILIYHHCYLYIALHHEASNMMGELLKNEKWAVNYRDLHLSSVKDRFSQVQNFVIVALLVNLLGMIFYTMKLGTIHENEYMMVVFGIAIVCICKVQLSAQKYFSQTFESVLKLFTLDVYQSKLNAVPLHTTPMLANFEYTFNQLSMKLEEREKEITQWLKHESEQFHLRTLGEVTAMVAHDMKTPLNVMSMSLDMLNDKNVSLEKKLKYKEILEKNLDLSLSFSQTLMAYVRGNKGEMSCVFGDVHSHLLEIFKTQFFAADLDRIRFTVSKDLATLNLKVSRLDAMHVFYNLYQNAIKSTLAQVPHDMSITLWPEFDRENNTVSIHLQDSGLGLDAATFYKLIRFERFGSDSQFYHGLGLRLTNSILGHLGGQFDIVPVGSGTCLKVTLPVVEEKLAVHFGHGVLETEQLHS